MGPQMASLQVVVADTILKTQKIAKIAKMQIEFVKYTNFIVNFFRTSVGCHFQNETELRALATAYTAATVHYHVYEEQSTRHTTVHRGRKGPFNYFQLGFLLARVKHLNITRYLRSNKIEIVEF